MLFCSLAPSVALLHGALQGRRDCRGVGLAKRFITCIRACRRDFRGQCSEGGWKHRLLVIASQNVAILSFIAPCSMFCRMGLNMSLLLSLRALVLVFGLGSGILGETPTPNTGSVFSHSRNTTEPPHCLLAKTSQNCHHHVIWVYRPDAIVLA